LLRDQGLTAEEIAEAVDHSGDPLLESNAVRAYCGGISTMTLWRWSAEHGFPQPDLILSRRRFWKRSTLDAWITARIVEQAPIPVRRPHIAG
jgi:predicted DNA-binding transcriptional regulator AlpA